MKTPAELAIENSIAFDVKKDGLQQRQNGDWVLRVTVAALDMHQVIVNAKMGAIFQCVLVEKGDDEMPVDHVAQERDRWVNLGPARQAGMRCKDPVFWAYLTEEHDQGEEVAEIGAANFVRTLCRVKSRSDLDKHGYGEARRKWHELDNAFQAWRAMENA
jgi:hypothetical protein